MLALWKNWKKFRTMALGIIAVGMLAGGTVVIFEVPAREMGEILLASVSVVLLVVVCAFLMGYLLSRFRR